MTIQKCPAIRRGFKAKCVLLAFGAVLGLSACASTNGTNDVGVASESVTPQLGRGPLDEYRLRIFGDFAGETQEQAQARETANHLRIEQLIAACMLEHGFTYIPETDNAPTVTFLAAQLGPQIGSREWAELYGFGVSSNQSFAAGGGSDRMISQGANAANDALLAAMSDAEAEAWHEALWGNDQGHGGSVGLGIDEDGNLIREEIEPEPRSLADAGCQDIARAEVHGASGFDEFEFTAIQRELGFFAQMVANDNRVAQLHIEWGACMAEFGFPDLAAVGQLRAELNSEWSSLMGRTEAGMIDGFYWVSTPVEINWSDQQAVAEQVQRVNAFESREIEAALASYDCNQQISFDQRLLEIDHDLQQQFVNMHRNELEAWAEYAESRRAG